LELRAVGLVLGGDRSLFLEAFDDLSEGIQVRYLILHYHDLSGNCVLFLLDDVSEFSVVTNIGLKLLAVFSDSIVKVSVELAVEFLDDFNFFKQGLFFGFDP